MLQSTIVSEVNFMTQRFKVGQMVRWKPGIVANIGRGSKGRLDQIDMNCVPSINSHMPAKIWKVVDGEGFQSVYLDIPNLRNISCSSNSLEIAP